MSDKLSNCAECGMPCAHGEYHPHAACLMFNGCYDSTMVRAGLAAIREHALAASPAPAIPAEPAAPKATTSTAGEPINGAQAATQTAPAISESEDAAPNPWVPKSASLPSEPGWYLVMLDPDNDWGLMSHTPLQVEFDVLTRKPREFTCIYDWRTDEVITPAVTHWMPMPAGPGDAARKGGKS